MSKSSERKSWGLGSYRFKLREARGCSITLHGYRKKDAIKKVLNEYGRDCTFDVEEITTRR